MSDSVARSLGTPEMPWYRIIPSPFDVTTLIMIGYAIGAHDHGVAWGIAFGTGLAMGVCIALVEWVFRKLKRVLVSAVAGSNTEPGNTTQSEPND